MTSTIDIHELGADQVVVDPQEGDVGADPLPQLPAISPASPMALPLGAGEAFSQAQGLLVLSAQTLTDLEAVRIANENRLRALRDVYGLAGSPQEAEAIRLVKGITDLEHQAILTLQRTLRQHPLGPWVKRTQGVGPKQGARLLAAIGDPYIRPEITRPDDTVEPARPRLVSELWAYCGYHVIRIGQTAGDTQLTAAGAEQPSGGGDASQVTIDAQRTHAGVAPTRARGQRANWSAEAKMRTFLVAESCMKKMDSPYRKVYDEGRVKYADAVHQVECRRCGPKNKPALVGSPLSAGHQHARAIRLMSKAILRDLWLEARAYHTGEVSV